MTTMPPPPPPPPPSSPSASGGSKRKKRGRRRHRLPTRSVDDGDGGGAFRGDDEEEEDPAVRNNRREGGRRGGGEQERKGCRIVRPAAQHLAPAALVRLPVPREGGGGGDVRRCWRRRRRFAAASRSCRRNRGDGGDDDVGDAVLGKKRRRNCGGGGGATTSSAVTVPPLLLPVRLLVLASSLLAPLLSSRSSAASVSVSAAAAAAFVGTLGGGNAKVKKMAPAPTAAPGGWWHSPTSTTSMVRLGLRASAGAGAGGDGQPFEGVGVGVGDDCDDFSDLRLLLIDHYDSFTYNLVDMLERRCGSGGNTAPGDSSVTVVASDAADSWDDLMAKLREREKKRNKPPPEFDGIILSPGPGRPHDARLALDVVRRNCGNGDGNDGDGESIPILGVCLGHQVLGLAHGAAVVPLQEKPIDDGSDSSSSSSGRGKRQLLPIHGQVWNMRSAGLEAEEESPLLRGIFDGDDVAGGNSRQRRRRYVQATRYHSLHVTDLEGKPLQPLLYSQGDDVVMAFQHRGNNNNSLPHYGVQFHPESVGTHPSLGVRLVDNFCQICRRHKLLRRREQSSREGGEGSSSAAAAARPTGNPDLQGTPVKTTKVNGDSQTIVDSDLALLKNGRAHLGKCDERNGVPLTLNGAELRPSAGIKNIIDNDANGYVAASGSDASSNNVVNGQQETRDDTETRNGVNHVKSSPRSGDKALGGDAGASNASHSNPQQQRHSVYVHKVALPPEAADLKPEAVMDAFLSNLDYAFWLDDPQPQQQRQVASSVAAPNGSIVDPPPPPVSILGTTSKEHGHLVEYYLSRPDSDPRGGAVNGGGSTSSRLRVLEGSRDLLREYNDLDILTFLQGKHGKPTDRVTMVNEFGDVGVAAESAEYAEADGTSELLPFDFRGGHVGYLGYEVRHDTARYLREQESGAVNDQRRSNKSSGAASAFTDANNDPSKSAAKGESIPTAAFLWADRSFVYDHKQGDWYLVGLAYDDESKVDALSWMRETAEQMRLGGIARNVIKQRHRDRSSANVHHSRRTLSFVPNRSKESYNRNFDQCLDYIRQGESYELCLTNKLEAKGVRVPDSSPLDFYKVLRRRNPAPHSAFYTWGSSRTKDKSNKFAICCSSPERFISVKPQKSPSTRLLLEQRPAQAAEQRSRLQVEAKPIKGTCARVVPANGSARSLEEEIEDARRADELEFSLKNRAENLMIVDLLRNDLNRVCETGSVHVSTLMGIESFATVHQLVSTIRGTLKTPNSNSENGGSSSSTSIDVLKACFPGGSMTGAPKLRTMELLDEIEEGVPRGPYSGCLGYISVNGCMDMNIVIRTAVLTPTPSDVAGDGDVAAASVSGADDDDDCCWDISIGAGGAITALSESDDEYDEMMLKASAVINAAQEWVSGSLSATANSSSSLSNSSFADDENNSGGSPDIAAAASKGPTAAATRE